MSERTERNCNKCIRHTSGDCDSWDCKMQTVEDVKKEAVNEYAKSVVEELEERKALHERLVDYETKNGTVTEKYQHIKAIDVLNDAIEIVKHGGVSDDVCEWKSDYGFISDKYKRETRCGYTFYDLHHAVPFKYCPYCGKKIKVVELWRD